MNESHYVSLEIARQLVEDGIVVEGSEKIWEQVIRISETQNAVTQTRGDWKIEDRDRAIFPKHAIRFPAPNLSELLDLLPDLTHVWKEGGVFTCYIRLETGGYAEIEASTAPDAAALMLLNLKKQGISD